MSLHEWKNGIRELSRDDGRHDYSDTRSADGIQRQTRLLHLGPREAQELGSLNQGLKMTNEGVPDTLYIPLAARIYSTQMFPEYFSDSVSLRFKRDIPKSITDGSSEYAMLASVARYYNTDRMEREFVKRNGRSSNVSSMNSIMPRIWPRTDTEPRKRRNPGTYRDQSSTCRPR